MNCPACQHELRMADRQGVEIDYCPQCRGVWLDRGELDKIIERSERSTSEGQRFASPSSEEHKRFYEREAPFERHWDEDAYERDMSKGRRRKSFLGELFDFD
jgi:Zn-finger nucleic acid-binding protein